MASRYRVAEQVFECPSCICELRDVLKGKAGGGLNSTNWYLDGSLGKRVAAMHDLSSKDTQRLTASMPPGS